MKSYTVHEAHLTVQGEGVYAGTACVLVRFAGCNVWSGCAEDRARDAQKGYCARYCDTTFTGTNGVNGGKYSAHALADLIEELRGARPVRMVLLTGGEPSLQVDDRLVSVLHARRFVIHVETNGSNVLPQGIDWVTLSPKPPLIVRQRWVDELKVLHPCGVSPLAVAAQAVLPVGVPCFVQPLDGIPDAVQQCLTFIQQHPFWRLSLQTHKLLGLP